MALINAEALALNLTWSHTWSTKIDNPITPHAKCLEFCIKAFGAGVIKNGEQSYLRSDPRYYLHTRLCEVATDGDIVGVSFVLQPDDAVLKERSLVMRRVERFMALHPELKIYVSKSGIVQSFLPIGQVILNGEPSLGGNADKDRIGQVYQDFLQLLNTGCLPGESDLQESVVEALRCLAETPGDDLAFCY